MLCTYLGIFEFLDTTYPESSSLPYFQKYVMIPGLILRLRRYNDEYVKKFSIGYFVTKQRDSTRAGCYISLAFAHIFTKTIIYIYSIRLKRTKDRIDYI